MYSYKKRNQKLQTSIGSIFHTCDQFNGVTLFSSDTVTVIALAPLVTVTENSVTISNDITTISEPLQYIDTFIAEHDEIPKEISFIGHISYDAKNLFEEDNLYKINGDDSSIPLINFSLYKHYIFFNNNFEVDSIYTLDEKQLSIISKRLEQDYYPCFSHSTYVSTSNHKESYEGLVSNVVDHIREGDMYQLNLSRDISAETTMSAVDVALKLYNSNSIEYGVFQKINDTYIISTSPELFFQVNNGKIKTSPIKGTISTQESNAVAKLKNSKKEISELAMIVDLLRNDISRICKVGTVTIGDFPEIIELKNVYHAYCDIFGELKSETSLYNIMKAMFPGGSISGCPKIKACQIIEELENRPRGIYTGTFGYYNFKREMVFNILIRTVTMSENTIKFSVGGGITILSNPEDEFNETIYRADPIWKSLNLNFVEEERSCIRSKS